MQTLRVTVNGQAFDAAFADTAAAEAFKDMLPMTVEAAELNGNEKYAKLPESLPTDGSSVPTQIEAGDIFLYGGDDVVLFYETHANGGWSYVPIAHIDDASGLVDAVGAGDATVTYELGNAA